MCPYMVIVLYTTGPTVALYTTLYILHYAMRSGYAIIGI